MIYEVRTYTLRPGTVAEFEERFAKRLALREKHSKLGAFWHTEFGPLNQVIHVYPYDDLQHRTAVRTALAQDTARQQLPGGGDLVVAQESEIMIPAPFMALYSASKHAVEGYSESLDHEIRGSGVRVVLVEPAYTRTSFEGNVYQADQQLDVYRSARTNAEGVLRDGMKTADAPELVASAVVKASTELNPRRRYTAGRAARQISLLRRFVPASAFDKSLRKQMRLPA